MTATTDINAIVNTVKSLSAEQCEHLYRSLRDELRVDYDNLFRMGREHRYHAERGTRRADEMERRLEEATSDYQSRAMLKSVLAVRTARIEWFAVGDTKVTAADLI